MRNYFIVASIVFIIFQLSHVVADEEGGGITIHVPGESEMERFSNVVWVTGIWHYVNVTLDENITPTTLTLILHRGDSIPAIKNKTTYYSWQYDDTGWKDLMEYEGISFIDVNKCKKSGKTYSFYIGTSDFVKNYDTDGIDYENWTLTVKADGTEIYSIPVVMEEAVTRISVSRPDFTMQCAPFNETTLTSTQTFLTANTGNVPLHISISYNKFNDRINTSNFNTTLHINESLGHSISIKTLSWPPGFISISGVVRADALYVIPTGFVSFDTSLNINNVPHINIKVGHSDYEIEEIGANITFQYEKSIEMEYGEIRNITAYVCGNGNVTFSLSNTNSTILNVWSGEELVENIQRFVVHSTNTSEHPIIVSIQASKPNATAYLVYTLEIGNETYSYTTIITVGPEQSIDRGRQGNPLVYAIVGLALIGVVGYIVYNRIRYRR